MKKLINENIPQKGDLLFYNVSKTKYEEDQLNFESTLFNFMKNNEEEAILKRKKTLLQRQRTLNKSRIMLKEE